MKNQISLYCLLFNLKTILKDKFLKKLGQDGMGTIEVIIIIAVLVALALLFKTFVMDLSDGIFAKIQEKTDAAINSL